ncbi:MAG: hypothetical protein IKT90_02035 [Clostridia bacterium]|nr:hypothetical protein [Clostridia bacterium]
MRNWIVRFMEGRHGVDHYSRFLSIVSCVMLVLFMISRWQILWYMALFLLIYSYFRAFSRNRAKRQAENRKYLTVSYAVTSKFRARKQRMQQSKNHRFFPCPGCKAVMRVPRGKGKIEITCPQCGMKFVRKS